MSKCYVSKIVELCKAEKGYHEKASNSQLDDKTANSGSKNWNKYAAYIDEHYPDFYNGKKNGYAWCDVYVDCMFIQAYGLEDALRLTCQPEKSLGASVRYSHNYYNSQGRISKTPIIGAQVFFQQGGELTHTGIVIDMTPDKVLVSAGNTSDAVREIWYDKSDTYIYDYGIPAYDPEPEGEPTDTLTIDVDTTKYNRIVLNLK